MNEGTTTSDLMGKVRSSFVFSVGMVVFGLFFIFIDRNGTRPIGYFVVVVAAGMAIAASFAIRKLRRGR